MKLQLNKLMAGLVMAGGAVALVGCGDGGSPTLGASSDLTKTIKAGDTVAISAAQTIVKAFGETGADFKLATAIVFDANVTTPAASVPTIPANSVLNINPTTVAGAIGDFKITAPNTDKTVEGVVLPGSCKFQVTGPTDQTKLLGGYIVGETYQINDCAITLPTAKANVLVGVIAALNPSLTLKSTTTEANRTISITVNDNGSVTARVPTTNAQGVTTFTTVDMAPAGSITLTTGG